MSESRAQTLVLDRIGQIAVPVTDVERAVRFYRDTLGMRFLFQAPPGLAFFDLSGVRLMLDGPAKAQAGKGSVLYYQVADLQAAFATLSESGASDSKPSRAYPVQQGRRSSQLHGADGQERDPSTRGFVVDAMLLSVYPS